LQRLVRNGRHPTLFVMYDMLHVHAMLEEIALHHRKAMTLQRIGFRAHE
jgi:hypothetical protein